MGGAYGVKSVALLWLASLSALLHLASQRLEQNNLSHGAMPHAPGTLEMTMPVADRLFRAPTARPCAC
jgi:hypothetical protein